MKTKTTTKNKGAHQAHRDAVVGKGVPGLHNGQRSVRFADRKKVAAKKACRGKVSY